jgi:sarcosine oxidase, subunit gamma
VADLASDGLWPAAVGHYGATAIGIALSEATIAAAWNLHGNPAQRTFTDCAQQLFGAPLPQAPNTATADRNMTMLWLGPRSWLLVESRRPELPPMLADLDRSRDAVNAAGGALFDVSASRVAYRVSGTHAEVVLAKSCPLDFDRAVFPAGACAQSLFGRMNALVYRPDAASTFLLLVARSLAGDAWRLLCRSSAQYGYDVTAQQPFGTIS